MENENEFAPNILIREAEAQSGWLISQSYFQCNLNHLAITTEFLPHLIRGDGCGMKIKKDNIDYRCLFWGES